MKPSGAPSFAPPSHIQFPQFWSAHFVQTRFTAYGGSLRRTSFFFFRNATARIRCGSLRLKNLSPLAKSKFESLFSMRDPNVGGRPLLGRGEPGF
jgi:hypothetical protein